MERRDRLKSGDADTLSQDEREAERREAEREREIREAEEIRGGERTMPLQFQWTVFDSSTKNKRTPRCAQKPRGEKVATR